MNFLPAVKLAMHAKDFLARLTAGEKQSAGAADPKKAANLPGVKDTNISGAKNASGFSDILRRAEEADYTTGPKSGQDIRERAALAARNAPAALQTKQMPSLKGDIPAALNTKQLPALKGDISAALHTKQMPALKGDIPAALSTMQVPPLQGDAPAAAITKNIPSAVRQTPPLAENAPFSNLLRRAAETGRNTGHEFREQLASAARNAQAALHSTRDGSAAAPASLNTKQDTPFSAAASSSFNTRDLQNAARQIPALAGARKAAELAGDAPKLSDILAGKEGVHRKLSEITPSPAQKSGHSDRQPESGAKNSASNNEARQSFDLYSSGREGAKTQQQYVPLEKAPAVPHSDNGVHYQLGEVGFTQRELAKLRNALLREGLAPSSLTAIEQLASHPHGATLGQLLALMHGNLLRQVSLSKEDSRQLQDFAGKIDADGELGKRLPQLLENGQLKEAWDALKSSLAEVNPADSRVFEPAEAALLCKLFGVSERTSQTVLQQFGYAEGLPLTLEFFTALMLPAQQEILDRVQQDDKLGPALAKHLQPLIAEARQRSETERKAAEGADRKSKQTEILIRDKLMDAVRKDVIAPERDENEARPLIAEKNSEKAEQKDAGKHTTQRDESGRAQAGIKTETHTRQNEAQDPRAQDAQGAAKTEAHAGKTPIRYEEALAAQDKNSAAPAAKTDAIPAPKAHAPAGQEASNRADADSGHRPHSSRQDQDRGDTRDTARDTQRDARAELLSRVEVRPSAPSANTHAAFTMPAQPQEQPAGQQNANPAPLIRQALQQVEQGTLNKLAGGEQRLELQLAPSELGAVTLILTSAKSGEISATIRSERSETVELVARHLDMIRVSLEEQGLKVDKLEVQNQMLNNRDDWQGMEQHNAMRDGQERREYLERLRRLGRQDGNGAPQARDVQLHEHTAEISGHGLHLVA